MGFTIRMVSNGSASTRQVVSPEGVAMIQQATAGWTPEYLRKLVATGTVPESYLELAIKFLLRHPALLLNEKPQFLAACHVARPDIVAILETPAGDRWMDTMGDELGRRLVTSGLKFLGLMGRA